MALRPLIASYSGQSASLIRQVLCVFLEEDIARANHFALNFGAARKE